MLQDCTLCPNKEDPRFGLMTKDGDFYPLCDGCSPAGMGAVHTQAVAERCRALGPPFGNSVSVPRFGCNERSEPSPSNTPTSSNGESGT